MEISSLPIPPQIIELLNEEGIKTLYPPQTKAIEQGLLDGTNMVVAIPTASGKTLLALLASLKSLEQPGIKVLYLSPLKALAYEKYQEFRKYFNKLNKRVVLLTGDYDAEDRKAYYADIIIATNEKVDSALRHNSKWLTHLGVIIADEVHLINDGHRGPTLEVVLAQLRQITQAQILALSATIKNADQIARWLQAELISSEWRPVELKEGVLYGNRIIYADEKEKKIPHYKDDSFLNLIEYILKTNAQALIFNTTRRTAESTAKKMARLVKNTLSIDEQRELVGYANMILDSGEKTKQAKEIAELLKNGSCYHHAGLSPTERRGIEEAFKKGCLKTISATPTLAAGVNLPARYVIIKSIYRYNVTLGNVPIPVLEFKQQSGRAGRPQYDKQGDALVYARSQKEATDLFNRYILSDTEDIDSKLASEPALRSIILGQIASENTQTMEELYDFFSQTFYGFQQNPANLSTILSNVIDFLREEALITNDEQYLLPTKFGKRVSQLYIDPLSAVVLRSGIIRANQMADYFLKDLSFLHLVCSTPDVRFINARKNEQIQLMNFITNHEEEFITEMPQTSFDLELFINRVKTALILRDWIKETPEDTILDRYNVYSGDVYSIVNNSEWILYAAGEISKLLGYEKIAAKITILHQRIIDGIKEELLNLVQIKGVGRVRARTLFDHGYKTVEDLKQAKPSEIIDLPGFGAELVKNIYIEIFGKQEGESLVQDLPIREDEQKDTSWTATQKSLDEFF